MEAASATLTSITVFPVKACRGIPLTSAVVTPAGLLFDRNWVVVKESNGKFITQRQDARLALVETGIVPQRLLEGAELAACPDAKLVLRAPGMPELQVPITPTAEGKKLVPTTVWDWSGLAADEGDAAGAWLSEYLGVPARLVRFVGQVGAPGSFAEDTTRRQVDPDWTPVEGTHEVAFADGFPYLIANQASMEELNRQLAAKGEPALAINRFRPNLIVAGPGAGPFAEDGWHTVRIGGGSSGGAADEDGVEFECTKPCSRCKVTTINQETAEEGLEPLAAMAVTRSGRVLGWEHVPSFRGAVFFGVNALARQPGVVRVGDAMAVTGIRTGPPTTTVRG